MYYLILGGGAIMGYKYSNDIRDWGIKQNNYLVDYFRKQHLIIDLIKLEKIVYINIDDKYNIKHRFFINIETLEQDFIKLFEMIKINNPTHISYLLIEYKVPNNDTVFRFNYPIDINNFEENLINFKNNFDINNKKTIDDDNLVFLNNYHNKKMTLNIVSVDYSNNDITDIITSYGGINQDFHIHKIDFRELLDLNYNLIYNGTTNVNIIKTNLDIVQLNLQETRFLFISNLY
jgi:hypothetical protein